MKGTQWLGILFLIVSLAACTTTNMFVNNDPLYLNYKQFAEEMDNAVARGEITAVQAATAKTQAYNKYVEQHTMVQGMANQRQSQSMDYLDFLKQLEQQAGNFV